MNYNNNSSRFAAIKRAVEAVPQNEATGTGWRAMAIPAPDHEPTMQEINREKEPLG